MSSDAFLGVLFDQTPIKNVRGSNSNIKSPNREEPDTARRTSKKTDTKAKHGPKQNGPRQSNQHKGGQWAVHGKSNIKSKEAEPDMPLKYPAYPEGKYVLYVTKAIVCKLAKKVVVYARAS